MSNIWKLNNNLGRKIERMVEDEIDYAIVETFKSGKFFLSVESNHKRFNDNYLIFFSVDIDDINPTITLYKLLDDARKHAKERGYNPNPVIDELIAVLDRARKNDKAKP